MPPHMHHPEPHDHHPYDHHEPVHGGQFSNWGWSNAYAYPDNVVVEQDTPVWVWIVGGALAGMLLAGTGRN